MTSISTSERAFTLLELVLAMALTVTVALAILPAWASLQSRSVQAGDRVTKLLQARVASARLERDLRLASATGSESLDCDPLLEASPRQLVLVTRPAGGQGQELVEWEVVGTSLMRRRGPWSGSVPGLIHHGLYTDHKTMLEDVGPEARFSYLLAGRRLQALVAPRGNVEEIMLIAPVTTQNGADKGGGVQSDRAVILRALAGVGR